eukprot:GHUV01008347.1.p2 GENE.GHUV01008347.1~~GHUV01008347.1.p2  ORF type:complete len:113 (+),score=11.77 GHUV01008347.1:2865-3203(+)
MCLVCVCLCTMFLSCVCYLSSTQAVINNTLSFQRYAAIGELERRNLAAAQQHPPPAPDPGLLSGITIPLNMSSCAAGQAAAVVAILPVTLHWLSHLYTCAAHWHGALESWGC